MKFRAGNELYELRFAGQLERLSATLAVILIGVVIAWGAERRKLAQVRSANNRTTKSRPKAALQFKPDYRRSGCH